MKKCNVEGCENEAGYLGLCEKHLEEMGDFMEKNPPAPSWLFKESSHKR